MTASGPIWRQEVSPTLVALVFKGARLFNRSRIRGTTRSASSSMPSASVPHDLHEGKQRRCTETPIWHGRVRSGKACALTFPVPFANNTRGPHASTDANAPPRARRSNNGRGARFARARRRTRSSRIIAATSPSVPGTPPIAVHVPPHPHTPPNRNSAEVGVSPARGSSRERGTPRHRDRRVDRSTPFVVRR